MHSSPVSFGKRPEIKHSRSVGWSWPRLVPINEQQSRSSHASQSSGPPSVHDRNDHEEPSTAMISTTASDLHAEEETPLSPVLSAARSPPNARGHVAWTVQHQPDGHHPDEIGSAEHTALKSAPVSAHGSAEDVAQMNAPTSAHRSAEDAAEMSASASAHGSAEDVAQMNAPTSAHRSAEDAAEMSASASAHGSAEDVAQMSAPASEHRPIEDITTESNTEMPVAYENTSV